MSIINGTTINNIVKNLNIQGLQNLYWNKSRDKRFKYLSSGNQGTVYKLGNYVVKIVEQNDYSPNEVNAIKLIIEHPEFYNFVRYYGIWKTKNYIVYVMNFINYDFRKWFEQKNSDRDWLIMLFQMLMILYQMHDVLKIYHNDLQMKNIMCSKYDTKQKLIYFINDTKYEIETNYIFRLIDFGSASHENQKVSYVSDDDLLKTFLKKLITIEILNTYKTKEDILKNIKLTEDFKAHIKYRQDKLDNRVKHRQMNQNTANDLMRKEIIYYAIDNNLIDISKFKDKISKPGQDVIKLFEYYETHDILENINMTYKLLT